MTHPPQSEDQNLRESPGSSELEEGRDYVIEAGGLLVWTKDYLLKRGFCCGSACRNCPYDHENVPSENS